MTVENSLFFTLAIYFGLHADTIYGNRNSLSECRSLDTDIKY